MIAWDERAGSGRPGPGTSLGRTVPGADHFPVVFDKLARAIVNTTQTLADLARISAPTLIMAGDDDLVTVEHQEAMRAAVQDGQLAIVPGASHGLPLEKPDLVARLIVDFLADRQVPKLMPGPDAYPRPRSGPAARRLVVRPVDRMGRPPR